MGTTKATAGKTSGKMSDRHLSEEHRNSPLHKFFIDALQDIYWAEQQLTKALPVMSEAATTSELKSVIEEHFTQTQEHVRRLEKVFESIGEKPKAKKCEAMDGLVKESHTIIEETAEGTITRDVGIIMAAQKVEHYEIATYGGLVTLAKVMGHEEAAEILYQTLEEEKQAD